MFNKYFEYKETVFKKIENLEIERYEGESRA